MKRYPTISFTNLATVDLGVDLKKLVPALTTFLVRCFVPVWGYPAKLKITKTPDPKHWQMLFFDDADAAGALGYHDITKDGQPVSKVFVNDTINAGELVSVTTCHELCEMLIDPVANLWAEDSDTGLLHAYEMCDAVEEETFKVKGIAMSDFVFPSFFESFNKGRKGVQYDWMKKVKQPFETLKMGYQIVLENGDIHEVFGSEDKETKFAHEDRRMHRSEKRVARIEDSKVG